MRGGQRRVLAGTYRGFGADKHARNVPLHERVLQDVVDGGPTGRVLVEQPFDQLLQFR